MLAMGMVVDPFSFVENLRDGSGRDEPCKERASVYNGASPRLMHCAPFGALRLSARLMMILMMVARCIPGDVGAALVST